MTLVGRNLNTLYSRQSFMNVETYKNKPVARHSRLTLERQRTLPNSFWVKQVPLGLVAPKSKSIMATIQYQENEGESSCLVLICERAVYEKNIQVEDRNEGVFTEYVGTMSKAVTLSVEIKASVPAESSDVTKIEGTFKNDVIEELKAVICQVPSSESS